MINVFTYHHSLPKADSVKQVCCMQEVHWGILNAHEETASDLVHGGAELRCSPKDCRRDSELKLTLCHPELDGNNSLILT